MLSNTILLVGGYLAPVGAVFVGVLWVRPAVARAQVEREALLIRDKVIDGILAGEIDDDNPRARDAIMFCEFIAGHSRELSLAAAISTAWALKRAGIDVAAESRERRAKAVANSAGLATNEGERCLRDAEDKLDDVLSVYLVRGTGLWWILAPIQRVLRFLSDRVKDSSDTNPCEQLAATIKHPFPSELATDVRESSRGSDKPPPWWIAVTNGNRLRAASLL